MILWRKKFRCPNCGNIQKEGQWEEEMNRKSMAYGYHGFINLSAEPRCLKCESSLTGTPNKEVNGVCDICNRPTGTGRGGKVFTSKEMRETTEKGFNGMAIGSLGDMSMVFGLKADATYAWWKRKVMVDASDWLLCPDCQSEINKYMSQICQPPVRDIHAVKDNKMKKIEYTCCECEGKFSAEDEPSGFQGMCPLCDLWVELERPDGENYG